MLRRIFVGLLAIIIYAICLESTSDSRFRLACEMGWARLRR
jgi:hypothetical protein